MDIKIPFLGDGIESANVVAILVKPGDSVAIDQTLMELETDKATAPVPSLFDGVVDQISVKEGDVVKEGMLVVTLSGGGTSAVASVSSPTPKQSSPPVQESSHPQRPSALVPPQINPQDLTPIGDISLVKAAPSIFKFAKLSGLDLTRVRGSGHGGRITWDDIKAYVISLQSQLSDPVNVPESPKQSVKPKIDYASFGPIETQQLSSLRQKISNHLSNAWSDIPHVTQFADIQIDHIMALRKSLNLKLKKTDIKLSVTVLILRAIAETLKEHSVFNASLDGDQLVLKKYVHLGVAVDTDSGLVVPVIRDVDKKSLQDIAKELDELASKARDKKLAVQDIQGATFTLSNLGGLGASYFTPIVNSPEVAILGTGMASFVPKYDEASKAITNHLMMPIALSYDHRVIDGADGARFVQTLTKNIQEFDKKWVK